jgi:NADPH:quinone reductase-like Zn-dependent oxidoreductase
MNSSYSIVSVPTPWSGHATVAWLEGPRRLVWRDEPLPSTPPDASHLCETIVTAISPGTELGAWIGLPPLRPETGYPRLQGYCNVARVVASGLDTRMASTGDLVLSFTSHRNRFVLADEDVLLVLPQGLDLGKAAVTYLFHMGYDAVLRANVRPGSRVLVLGLGALGLASVALARAAGAIVVAISDHAVPQSTARSLGAAWAGPRSADVECAAAFDDHGADVVIITTNTWADWRLALSRAALRATVAVLGFPGRGQPPCDFNPLDSSLFYARQLRIQAVGMSPERPDSRGYLRFNERDNLLYLLNEIAARRLPADALISGSFPAPQLVQAYEALEHRHASPVTYLLQW